VTLEVFCAGYAPCFETSLSVAAQRGE
jgi:hypothetical protein